ncbi:uncharacterized protein LOC114516097 [Dendronephthya gigantea]|uniref:uncharacterized protein LOC114516097 n=1 Tax=Dendronephthya gigantea TaxID=151771 RepID=UPI00106C0143|nr:uncharacterized protein LOC114516097 [Dendronephthya gigantea]XP_028391285.1 uncharacterized protein LOC114516097 [Dendronephthya gigantea]XP_028391293.1 uncharacterized protein LOC114516097 [Dendronephthya gigantea]
MSAEKDEILTGRGGDLVCWNKLVGSMNAVCKLTITDKSDSINIAKAPIESTGSGSLVQVRLGEETIIAVLTNHHVIKNEGMAVKTLATFNYDGQSEPIHVNLCPDIFFRTSENYDYALVGLESEGIYSLYTRLPGICPLQLHRIPERDVHQIKNVQIAQHPHGRSKRFSVGRVCEVQDKFILYDADTTAGSSGSPVFFVSDEDCYVLALHKSGGVMTSERREAVNKGMFINIILDHLSGGPVKLLQPTKDKIRLSQSKPTSFSPQEAVRIGSRIPDKWEKIALATGKFNDKETTIIRLNHSNHDSAMQATVMINYYQRRQGTREEFVSALKEFGEYELAEKVESKYFQTMKS